MKNKKGLSSCLFDNINYIFTGLIMIIMIYPLMNVLSISLSIPDAVSAGKVTWFPKGFNINGYKYIIKDGQIFIGYLNTILYASSGTIVTLLFTSLAAYVLSVSDFIFRRGLMLFWAITMFFNGGLIPTYLVIKSLGLINTFWVMIIPGCVSAYTIFVFRTSFKQIPSELRESAYIDGANDLVIWWHIILPVSKALLATFALFTIVGHWNSWFNSLIYLKDYKRMPLQIFLRKLVIRGDLGATSADGAAMQMILNGGMCPRNAQMAAIILSLIPILCIYPYIQRYFVKGVMIGSIKA